MNYWIKIMEKMKMWEERKNEKEKKENKKNQL